MLLRAQNVSCSFGALLALSGASLDVTEGEIVGLIGPNGAGKSTFFNCVAGDLTPTGGNILFNEVDVTRAPGDRARAGDATKASVAGRGARRTDSERSAGRDRAGAAYSR